MSKSSTICSVCVFKLTLTPLMRSKINTNTLRLYYIQSMYDHYCDLADVYNKGYTDVKDDFFNCKCSKCKNYFFDFNVYYNDNIRDEIHKNILKGAFLVMLTDVFDNFKNMKFISFDDFINESDDKYFFLRTSDYY